MQKINRRVFSFLVATALSLSIEGCSTPQTPTTVAYKTVASVTTTVDTARQAWNSWVAAGNANASQVQQVANAYAIYQQSMGTAQIAIDSYTANPDTNVLNRVMISVSSSSANLLGLINTIMYPVKTQ